MQKRPTLTEKLQPLVTYLNLSVGIPQLILWLGPWAASMGIFSSTVPYIQQFGPFAYICIGLVTLLLLSVAYALYAWARVSLAFPAGAIGKGAIVDGAKLAEVEAEAAKRESNSGKTKRSTGHFYLIGLLFFVIAIVVKFVYEARPEIPSNVDPRFVTLPIATENELRQRIVENKTIIISRFPPDYGRVGGIASFTFQIRDREFRNCHFFGPATIVPIDRSTFDECVFEKSSGASLNSYLLLQQDRNLIMGVTPFIDCGFIGCRFFNVSIAGTEERLQEFRDSFRFGEPR